MLRRTLALVLMGLALASPAWADRTYYVNPAIGVNDTVTHGASAAAPLQSLSYLNTYVRQPNTTNGHIIVYLADWEPGYNALPQPVNHPANGKRYFFIGNPDQPRRVRVPGGTLYRAYVTIRGVEFTSSLNVDSTGADDSDSGQPYADSVVKCVLPGFAMQGAKYCVMHQDTVTGVSVKFGGSSNPISGGVTMGNKFEYMVFPNLGQGTNINHVVKFIHIDSCTFSRCTFKIRVQAQGWAQVGVAMFMARYSTWDHCRFEMRKTATDEPIIWKMRNGSRGNHFVADTILNLGPVTGAINLVQNGGTDPPDHTADGLTGNSPAYWDSCQFFNASGTINVGDAASDLHFNYCTFLAWDSPGFTISDGEIGDSLEFQHCTFVAPVGDAPLSLGGDTDSWQSDLKVTLKSNIFSTFVPYNQPFSGDITCTRDRKDDVYAHNGVTARLDSVNRNVHWNRLYNTASGDRVWWINGTCYAVGASAVSGTSPMTALKAGVEKVSVHSDPLFVTRPDSLYNGLPAFNARIAATSPARGLGYSSTDAGAVAYNSEAAFRFVPSDPDTTAVTDTIYAASYADTFTISNDGVANLEATFTALMATSGAVITLDTTAVLIAGGRARTFTATYYTPGFSQPAGVYVDYLIFATNDPARPTIYRPFVRTRGTFSLE